MRSFSVRLWIDIDIDLGWQNEAPRHGRQSKHGCTDGWLATRWLIIEQKQLVMIFVLINIQ